LIQYARCVPDAATIAPPISGPAAHAMFSTVRKSGDEIRQAGVHGGAEDRVAEAADRRQSDDRRRRVHERKRHEHERAAEIRRDHQPPPLEPVEQWADDEADHDRRQKDGDEERADPAAGVRPVPDLDRQGDRRQPCAEQRSERGEKQQAKAGVAAKERDVTHGAVRE